MAVRIGELPLGGMIENAKITTPTLIKCPSKKVRATLTKLN